METPIDQFDLKGDWSEKAKKRGFDPASIKLLTNPKYVEKIKTQWNKTDYTFDLYFVRSKEGTKFTEIGRVTPEFVKNELKLDIPINEDNITVIYTNNKGDEKVPLTSWIIAHRMAHAMARDYTGIRNGYAAPKSGNGETYYYDEIRNQVNRLIREVGQQIYGVDTKDDPRRRGYNTDNNSLLLAIINSLGTFKSARDNNVRAPFEMTNELIAQYIIQGKITLNKKLPEDIGYGKKAWGRSTRGLRKKEISEEDENDIIEYGEDSINNAIDTQLGASQGSIFVM